jgi:hypothetical protein
VQGSPSNPSQGANHQPPGPINCVWQYPTNERTINWTCAGPRFGSETKHPHKPIYIAPTPRPTIISGSDPDDGIHQKSNPAVNLMM